MGISFVRTIILYGAVIAAMRIMGKRTIGEMSTTELVVSIMISDLASVPMQSKSTPITDGIIPIFTLVFVELIFAFLTMKSPLIKRILVGRSRHIVKNGKLMVKEMESLRINIDDLEEQIRQAGYSSLSEVSELIVETTGQTSVVPKEENRPLTPKDMGLNPAQTKVPYVVIADGKLDKNKLRASGAGEGFLKKAFEKHGVSGEKEVMYMSVSDGKEVLFQKKKK